MLINFIVIDTLELSSERNLDLDILTLIKKITIIDSKPVNPITGRVENIRYIIYRIMIDHPPPYI